MTDRLNRTQLLRLVSLLFLVGLAPPIWAQAVEPTKLAVRPGAVVVLDSAGCIKLVVPPAGGAVEIVRVSEAKSVALYSAPSGQSADVPIVLETGAKEKADKSGCEPGANRHFTVSVAPMPEVSDAALTKSFNVLLSAFVLALLLESAFALLFNWRLFLEFFVGKAWRTPIMFVGALLIVRNFDLDLMATLFEAYSPRAEGVAARGSWFTSALTAMILAGGSVGVNRLLIALGFRSQIRPDAVEPKLAETEAWIAIRVDGGEDLQDVRVDVSEVAVDATTGQKIPTTIGFIHPRTLGQRIKDLLFPSRTRVPRSGGRKVSTEKYYRITVADLRVGGKMYDGAGKQIQQIGDAEVFKFGSRAIVDLEIEIS